MRSSLGLLSLMLMTQLLSFPNAAYAEPAVRASRVSGQADFDGDGYADLAISVKRNTDGVDRFAGGRVQIVYGSANGLDVSRHTDLDLQQLSGAEPFPELSAMVAADFDGDGDSDLALGERFFGANA